MISNFTIVGGLAPYRVHLSPNRGCQNGSGSWVTQLARPLIELRPLELIDSLYITNKRASVYPSDPASPNIDIPKHERHHNAVQRPRQNHYPSGHGPSLAGPCANPQGIKARGQRDCE